MAEAITPPAEKTRAYVPHSSDKPPSLRLARVLTGLYSAFSNQFWNAWDMGWPT
jgi:hypothetical protein